MNIPQDELAKLNEQPIFDTTPEEELEEGEPKVVEKVSEPSPKDSVADKAADEAADKARIPYSRFETVNEAKIRAEERVKFLEEQLQANRDAQANDQGNPDSLAVPQEWTDLYGDNDTAREAYKTQLKLLDKLRDEATTKAIEEVERRQAAKQSEQAKNLELINQGLREAEAKLGRKLTDQEEAAILDIQDEFTPKDEQGYYLAPLIPAVKALEVLTLREGQTKADKALARRKVVSITGSPTEGEGSAHAFENYRPGVGGLWRDKLN